MQSCMQEKQCSETSCLAQGSPRVCGSCMGIAWMQKPGSCHFFIVCTKWMHTCWTWNFKIVPIARKAGSALQLAEARVAYLAALRVKPFRKLIFAERLRKSGWNLVSPSVRIACTKPKSGPRRSCRRNLFA